MNSTHQARAWIVFVTLAVSQAAACTEESPSLTTQADTSTPQATDTAPELSDSDSDSPDAPTTSTTTSASSSASTGGQAPPLAGGPELNVECGNGLLDPGEECDDGDDNAIGNACTGSCTLNVCGDGMKFEGVEECDLGPANGDGDDCGVCDSETCELGPYCGDGELDTKCGELCDGDESPMELPCAPGCRFKNAKLVFVTPDKYQGDLRAYTARQVDDGIDAADWICHDLALAAGLVAPPADEDNPPTGPRFRAWLSSATKPVTQRLNTTHNGIYVERIGTTIAVGWAGLTSGFLLKPITAGPAPEQSFINEPVWTNTRPNGEFNQPDLACVNWMTAEDGSGAFGFRGSLDSWTFIPGSFGERLCQEYARLYCIEE
jgi:hypothetical protein